MNAIAYIRCSTFEQADSGLGLAVQEERVRAYCTLKGLRLTEVITDAGVSGGKPLASRNGGKRLLNAIKGRSRSADAIVMMKLDRMFRNAGDCLNMVEQWDKSGIALHVLDLGGSAIDTASASGRFVLTILAGAAEMERNLTRERTRSALAVKRANGQRTGTIPFGYDLADDGVTLVANEREQEAIETILDMWQRGVTLKRIAAELTTQGVRTKTGRSAHWSHQAVSRILKRASTSKSKHPTSSG